MPDGVRCTYSGLNACLCTPVDPYTCQQDDPKCNALPSSFAAPPAEGGSGNRIVIPVAYTTCTCSTSEWQCSVVRP